MNLFTQTAIFYDQFLATRDGDIFSLYTNEKIPSHLHSGYLEVYLRHSEKTTIRIKLHRVIAYCFVPNPFNKPDINHLDGNKLNNNADNLCWCTPYENNLHARNFGLNNISESNCQRWHDSDFRNKTIEKFKQVRADNPQTGVDNPNHKYLLLFNGREYLVRELQEMFGCSEFIAYKYVKLMRLGLPNPWSQMGIVLK